MPRRLNKTSRTVEPEQPAPTLAPFADRPTDPPPAGRVPATGILARGHIGKRQAWAIEALDAAAVAVLIGDTEAFREWIYFPTSSTAMALQAIESGRLPEANGTDPWRIDAFDDGGVLANQMSWAHALGRLQ